MRAGRLRHRVVIEQAMETQGELGGVAYSWIPYASAWADVQPLSSRERLGAGEHASEITHQVVIRYLGGVTAAMRLRLADGRVLALEGPPIDVGARRREMQLLCKEVTE